MMRKKQITLKHISLRLSAFIRLKEFFLFKIYDFCYYNDEWYHYHSEISIPPLQLRHVYKIHSIPACNQCKWKKNSCDNGNYSHNFILMCILHWLIQFTYLEHIFTKKMYMILQLFHTVHKSIPTLCILFRLIKITGTKQFCNVYQLFIINIKLRKFLPMLYQWCKKLLLLPVPPLIFSSSLSSSDSIWEKYNVSSSIICSIIRNSNCFGVSTSWNISVCFSIHAFIFLHLRQKTLSCLSNRIQMKAVLFLFILLWKPNCTENTLFKQLCLTVSNRTKTVQHLLFIRKFLFSFPKLCCAHNSK